ncbi:hypothetical protein D3C76_1007890 [compost metagenome]
MADHIMQREQQHAAHRNPAGNNNGGDHQHNGGEDPQDAVVVAFIVLNASAGQFRLRLAPLAIHFLHPGLLLLGILLEHIFQIALRQQGVHLRQCG